MMKQCYYATVHKNDYIFWKVELLSPSVQTPRALAIFCSIHMGLSIALDITVGLVAKVTSF
jgi:hypothetical protein